VALGVQRTISDGGANAFGGVLVSIGAMLLVFSRDLAAIYRGMRGSTAFGSILSAYILPALFIAAGLVLIVAEAVHSN